MKLIDDNIDSMQVNYGLISDLDDVVSIIGQLIETVILQQQEIEKLQSKKPMGG